MNKEHGTSKKIGKNFILTFYETPVSSLIDFIYRNQPLATYTAHKKDGVGVYKAYRHIENIGDLRMFFKDTMNENLDDYIKGIDDMYKR